MLLYRYVRVARRLRHDAGLVARGSPSAGPAAHLSAWVAQLLLRARDRASAAHGRCSAAVSTARSVCSGPCACAFPTPRSPPAGARSFWSCDPGTCRACWAARPWGCCREPSSGRGQGPALHLPRRRRRGVGWRVVSDHARRVGGYRRGQRRRQIHPAAPPQRLPGPDRGLRPHRRLSHHPPNVARRPPHGRHGLSGPRRSIVHAHGQRGRRLRPAQPRPAAR